MLSLALQVDQRAVDEAIRRGVKFLRSAELQPWEEEGRTFAYDELVLLTYLHAGVEDPELLERVLATPETTTYRVALKAMILQKLGRHPSRLARCAQFLADNQCENGQWSYGEPSKYAEQIPIVDSKTRARIPIRAKKKGPEDGDNSNSQYAALGIRACVDGGIVFDKALLRRALGWWQQQQRTDGGWFYVSKNGGDSYGSMTAGAVGSMVIYLHLLGEPWKNDRRIASGLKWLGENFAVDANPKSQGSRVKWPFYYLYALERAGILYGTEKIGGHDWYPEGAKYLIEHQAADGSWSTASKGFRIADTCWAILFLRRATRPIEDVATKR